MTNDCLAIWLPGTDPAAIRRPCGCRGKRGAHQQACRLHTAPCCTCCGLPLHNIRTCRKVRRERTTP